MNKICVICGKSFDAKTIRAKYCCEVCAKHSRFKRSHDEIVADNARLSDWLKRLYDLGLNDRQISEEIGKSITWVHQKRIEMGLPRQISKSQLESERLSKWREEFIKERRICKRCKAEFTPKRVNQLFCCSECQRYQSHQINDIKRKRLVKIQTIDRISLDDVYKKYHGICYLCGEQCDYQAVKMINGIPHALGNYPSREHIIPISKGGLHSWDNVRLAHIKCNSSKGVKYG